MLNAPETSNHTNHKPLITFLNSDYQEDDFSRLMGPTVMSTVTPFGRSMNTMYYSNRSRAYFKKFTMKLATFLPRLLERWSSLALIKKNLIDIRHKQIAKWHETKMQEREANRCGIISPGQGVVSTQFSETTDLDSYEGGGVHRLLEDLRYIQRSAF